MGISDWEFFGYCFAGATVVMGGMYCAYDTGLKRGQREMWNKLNNRKQR